MFWWVLLPMFWTAGLLITLGAVAVCRGPHLAAGRHFLPTHRGVWLVLAVLAFPVLFAPTCWAVHHATFPFRCGHFT